MLQNSSALAPPASKECSQGSELQGPYCQRTETGSSQVFSWCFSAHGSIWSKLDLMILEVFSSPNDSMMPGKCPRLLTVLNQSYYQPSVTNLCAISRPEIKAYSIFMLSPLRKPPSLPLAVQPKNSCKNKGKCLRGGCSLEKGLQLPCSDGSLCSTD